MALIKCKECGHDSDRLLKCPTPCSQMADKAVKNKRISNKNVWVLCIMVLFAVHCFSVNAQNTTASTNYILQKSLATALQHYDDFLEVSDSLIAVETKNGYGWGFIDLNGKEIVPCKYEEVHSFSEGLALVLTSYEGREEIIKEIYKGMPEQDDVEFSSARFSSENEWIDKSSRNMCFINKKGEIVISQVPSGICGDFHDGRAFVQGENDKFGFIDTYGNVVIPFIYDDVRRFSNGVAWTEKDGKWGLIDVDGNIKIPHNIPDSMGHNRGRRFYDFSNEMAVWEGLGSSVDKYGYISKEGDQVIYPVYDDAYKFNEGYAVVYNSDSKNYSIINKHNNPILTLEGTEYSFYSRYDEGQYIEERKLCVSEGLLKVGKLFSSPKTYYESETTCDEYEPEEILVKKFGYIDVQGNVVIPFMFEYASTFNCGLAFVKLYCGKHGLRKGFVDKLGNMTFTDEELKYFKSIKLTPIKDDCNRTN